MRKAGVALSCAVVPKHSAEAYERSIIGPTSNETFGRKGSKSNKEELSRADAAHQNVTRIESDKPENVYFCI